MSGTRGRLTAAALKFSVVGSVLLMLTAGCADDSKAPGAATSTRPSAKAFSQLFSSYAVDYEVVESPDELQTYSDLVLTGVIRDLTDGRRRTVDDNPALSEATLVLQVEPSEIISGSLPDGNDGFVYVELPNPLNQDVGEYAKVYPRGATTALYLMPSRPGDPTIEDQSAGRPPAQAIWAPVSPQGFYLSDGQGGSIEVFEQRSYAAPVSRFLPPNPTFPSPE